MSDGLPLLPVWLYRMGDPDDDCEPWYGSMPSVQANQRVRVLGVAFRPCYSTITGATDRETFAANVEAVADDVRWFDDEVAT